MKRATGTDTLAKTGNVISIHALVKRATINSWGMYTGYIDFNPRPREEGDSFIYCLTIPVDVFQSTPS